MHWDRDRDQPTSEVHPFDDFEAMLQFAHKAKRRRRNADKATGAEYEVCLTELGRQVCEDDEHRRRSHESMLNKWHKVF